MLDPYLQRCLELARKGGVQAAPNPMVGSVIVHDDHIIGEGWHQRYGEAHAEVNAIRSVEDPQVLKRSTLYVSLEPCSHFGKTPPCSHLIAEMGIPRVVVGSVDPNPRVSGRGIAYLRGKGIEVEICPDQTPFIQLNKHFWLNQVQKRPWISLKWAMSRDGFIAGLDATGQPLRTAISTSHNLRFVHKVRSQHQAILIGQNTARIDDPSLTTRLFPGQNPIRILVDPDLSLPHSLKAFAPNAKVLILNKQREAQQQHLRYLALEPNWANTLQRLYAEQEIGSILVEGGKITLESFLKEGLFDELFITMGPQNLKNGVPAPVVPSGLLTEEYLNGKEKVLHWERPLEIPLK